MNKYLLALGVSALTPLAWAKPVIVTSIKPVSMVVAAITGDKAEIQQIVSSTASPHDFALRPSDLRKIANADTVVWVGESLESFLEKPLENAGKEDSSIEWLSLKGLELHNFGDDHDEHHDDHDEHEGHEGHEGHDHSGVDPHVWLAPENALVLAQAVTMRLVYLDSDNASYYKDNLAKFKKGLKATDSEIRHSLESIKTVPYIVFHDGYTYFEEHYGLNNVGEVTVSPERKPGAKKVAELRHEIEEHKVQCVFSEPQFSPAIVKSLLDGTKVNTAPLDPLGSQIKMGQNAYFDFLNSLSGQFLTCLK